MNEWNIQSRAHGCQSCAQPFADKQTYHTLLFDEKQHFRRLDICDHCWQTQYSQGAHDRKGFVSYWHGVYEAPPPAPVDPIQKETAETLLRKLLESNEPQHTAATYILAVMLERRRLLKVKEQFLRDGQRLFLYEQPKTGDLFTVADPNLQLNQLDEVQRDVAALLEHGLNPPSAPPAAPDARAPHSPAAAQSQAGSASQPCDMVVEVPADLPASETAPGAPLPH